MGIEQFLIGRDVDAQSNKVNTLKNGVRCTTLTKRKSGDKDENEMAHWKYANRG